MSNKSAYLDRYAEPDKGWTDRDECRWPVPYWDVDAGMAALLMLLTAVDEGLGACFFGIPPERIAAFRRRSGCRRTSGRSAACRWATPGPTTGGPPRCGAAGAASTRSCTAAWELTRPGTVKASSVAAPGSSSAKGEGEHGDATGRESRVESALGLRTP